MTGKYYDGADVMRSTPIATMEANDTAAILAVKLHGQTFYDLLAQLEPSREMSLAKTKIEEAVMWAVKGITA